MDGLDFSLLVKTASLSSFFVVTTMRFLQVLQRLKAVWGHRQVSGVQMERRQDRKGGQSWKQLSWLVAQIHTVRGILQARILEWVAFPFSRGSFQPRDRTQVSRIAGGVFTS